jgi:hypothetical protein
MYINPDHVRLRSASNRSSPENSLGQIEEKQARNGRFSMGMAKPRLQLLFNKLTQKKRDHLKT